VPAGNELLDANEPLTVTDADGRFVFPAVPPGQYSLRSTLGSQITTGGTRTAAPYWSAVPVAVGSADVDGVAVTLHAGLRISGQFAFEGTAPKPAAGAQRVPVVLEPAEGAPGIGLPGPSPADAAGQFTTAGVPAGQYFLRVTGSPVGWMFKAAMHNGQDLSETPIDLQADVTGVVITFTDRWTGMRGTVRAANGRADANALVMLFPRDPARWVNYGPSPRRLRSARATRDGEFSFTSLPAGDYYVVALPDEHVADWQDPKFLEATARLAAHVTLDEGDQKTVDLRTQEMR
jgi:hypothetical protein